MPIDRSTTNLRTIIVGSIGMLLLWLLLAWLIADSTQESRTREIIHDEGVTLAKQAARVAQSIDLGLDYVHGIPVLISREESVLLALSRFGASDVAPMAFEQRKKVWSGNSLLRRVDGYLGQVVSFLGADVAWVTNDAGDCIASSNAQKSESFIGTNYADREYFRMAKNGKPGRQYAMGRKTNIPGLYFSAPITINGRFAGVAVVKIDLRKLSQWFGQADVFISDVNGIIILAREPALEMRALPGAKVMSMPMSERQARYKRDDFTSLSINPWDPQHFPSVIQFDMDKKPLLLISNKIADEILVIHVKNYIPAAANFRQERLELFYLIGASGSIIWIIGVGLIVFNRIWKHTEKRTALSASLLRATIEATVEGIVVVGNEGTVTIYNQAFLKLWLVPAELLDRGWDDEMLKFVSDQVVDSDKFMIRIMEVNEHPELISFDTLQFKDGKIIERYSQPQRLGESIVGRVWSFRDVTEDKLTEQALRRSQEELESKVLERTADLQAVNQALEAEKTRQAELIKKLADAHNQLVQSEKMASIGQLAAGVAHEINNPVGFVNSNLTSLNRYVAGLLEMLSVYELAEGELTAATRDKVAELKQELDISYLRGDIGNLISESMDGLQRVKRIVLDLKDFSHTSATEMQWASLEQGMDSTINVVWNELKYKAELIKEYAGIPQIKCIPSQLNQVFLNLLTNAAQAIEQHGTITIRTGQVGDDVFVSISDTGGGISAENMKHLFEPFFTTKPVGMGTGLGLSIAYGIVQKHDGRIDVTSEVGQGTTFTVWLPIEPIAELAVVEKS